MAGFGILGRRYGIPLSSRGRSGDSDWLLVCGHVMRTACVLSGQTCGVPVGLDGNPEPVVSFERNEVLDRIAQAVLACEAPRVLVGVDGRAGSGKSTFADELAARLESENRPVVRSTTDSFHRPRAQRFNRGMTSGEGYYLDSHQLELIVEGLLRPFAAGESHVQTAAFDEPSDAPAVGHVEVGSEAVLIFDGLFVHRAEFCSFWDVSIFLEADERQDREWLTFLLDGLPSPPIERARALDDRLGRARWPRYRDGWQQYLEQIDPVRVATMIVDNNDTRVPRLQ